MKKFENTEHLVIFRELFFKYPMCCICINYPQHRNICTCMISYILNESFKMFEMGKYKIKDNGMLLCVADINASRVERCWVLLLPFHTEC